MVISYPARVEDSDNTRALEWIPPFSSSQDMTNLVRLLIEKSQPLFGTE